MENKVIVKFLPSELGAMTIPDSKIMIITPEEAEEIMGFFNGASLDIASAPLNSSSSEIKEEVKP